MKIFFHVEDDTDLSVLRALVRRLLDCNVDDQKLLRRPGGLGPLLRMLPDAVVEAARCGAAGLVVVRDNDENPPHQEEHERPGASAARAGCPYCLLLEQLQAAPQRSSLPPVKYVVGVPVQALEAWLLFGAQHANRRGETEPEKMPLADLKRRLYGADTPAWRKRKPIVLPIAEQVNLDDLARACPSFAFFRRNVLALKS